MMSRGAVWYSTSLHLVPICCVHAVRDLPVPNCCMALPCTASHCPVLPLSALHCHLYHSFYQTHRRYPGSYDDTVEKGLHWFTHCTALAVPPALPCTALHCPVLPYPALYCRFYQTHRRYPGSYDDTVEDDLPVLKGVAGQVLGELGVTGVAVQDDIVGEMCRWVGARNGGGGKEGGGGRGAGGSVGGAGGHWSGCAGRHCGGDVQVGISSCVGSVRLLL
jgi:uncharacterized membrane protein YgcG